MATRSPRRAAARRAPPPADVRPDFDASDVAKFTALVALSAIFVDAALGHGLTWENDPYWTYWVTKTFLIATIFGLGTAWFGIGVVQGAAITAVHTVVLTVYYWSLAPVGLPSSPEWLDLEHTWITGIPIHFAVIYLGYLLALYIRDRRGAVRDDADADAPGSLAALTLGVSVVIVVVAGALSSLAIADFPGVTWFVTRLLITFGFVFAWWSILGRGVTSSIVGGVLLAVLWATYGHFVAPSGLPDLPLRIFETSPPPADVYWASYRELWLVSLPIHIIVMALVMAVASRERERVAASRAWVPAVAVAALLGASSFIPALEAPVRTASVSATGPVAIATKAGAPTVAGTGTVSTTLSDVGGRVTPLPPRDQLELTMTVRGGGHVYDVRSSHAMVEDPLGRHTTWWGVGFDAEHHGRSGIGSPDLPAVESKVAAFGVARVRVDGRLVGTAVPVHVMTVDHGEIPGVRFAVDIGDADLPLETADGNMLRATWADYRLRSTDDPHGLRYALGGVVLALLVGALVLATRRTEADQTRAR